MVKLRCSECSRFLADVKDYGKAVCSACGAETQYKSKEERRRERDLTRQYVGGKVDEVTS